MRRSIEAGPKTRGTTPCKVGSRNNPMHSSQGPRRVGCHLNENSRTSRPGCFLHYASTCDQVEYLNSGIAFSSSLVALKMAWSGHQGLGFEAAGAVAAPVVVVEFGRAPAGAFDAPV